MNTSSRSFLPFWSIDWGGRMFALTLRSLIREIIWKITALHSNQQDFRDHPPKKKKSGGNKDFKVQFRSYICFSKLCWFFWDGIFIRPKSPSAHYFHFIHPINSKNLGSIAYYHEPSVTHRLSLKHCGGTFFWPTKPKRKGKNKLRGTFRTNTEMNSYYCSAFHPTARQMCSLDLAFLPAYWVLPKDLG